MRPDDQALVDALVAEFVSRRDQGNLELATDQLLNAVYLVVQGINPLKRAELRDALYRSLSEIQ
ncbi:MAG: hypothetical protein DMF64_20465 [Acidobacteria bacterium]|nr:MAG: hypothetical protein DMF64_20465 [Acidobacteriota bacterium]